MRLSKSNKLLFALIIFVISCVCVDKNGSRSVYNYNLSLNSGLVISYINSNTNVNTIDSQENQSKTDIVLAINTVRSSFTEDDYFYIAFESGFKEEHTSIDLFKYIQNYSCNRVLHPPLSQLQVLLI